MTYKHNELNVMYTSKASMSISSSHKNSNEHKETNVYGTYTKLSTSNAALPMSTSASPTANSEDATSSVADGKELPSVDIKQVTIGVEDDELGGERREITALIPFETEEDIRKKSLTKPSFFNESSDRTGRATDTNSEDESSGSGDHSSIGYIDDDDNSSEGSGFTQQDSDSHVKESSPLISKGKKIGNAKHGDDVNNNMDEDAENAMDEVAEGDMTASTPLLQSTTVFKINSDFPQVTMEKVSMELSALTTGHKLVKVKTARRKWRRHYHLDKNQLAIHYRSNRWICGSQERTIDIADIREIRRGWRTDRFAPFKKLRGRRKPIKENCCFSIIVGAQHKSTDLACDCERVRDEWVSALQYLVKRCKHVELERHHNAWIVSHYRAADVNRDGNLTLDECFTLLKQMNLDLPKKHVKRIFKEANVHQNPRGEESLDADEFLHFYKIISRRQDILQILNSYSEDGDAFLDASELHNFLLHEQKDDVPLDECERVIKKFEPNAENKEAGMLSVEGFTAFLLSADQQLFSPACQQVYHDMSRPLNEYFIASSHNTYLLEDQLSGPSSVEAYRRVLQKGCRCVEIDIWDGSNNEPVVYHGHTLTSKVRFKDVIVTCNRYAFVSSDYPLILSLENHCSVPQQKVMAKYMKSTFGDKLYTGPCPQGKLPSPEELKGKILIKGKHLPESPQPVTPGMPSAAAVKPPDPDEVAEVSDEDEAEEFVEAAATLVKPPPLPGNLDESDSKSTDKEKKKKKKKIKLSAELSQLVFLKSVHFSSFDHCKSTYGCDQMCSLGEKKASKLSKDQTMQFVRHSQRFLSRTYPAGTRTDSSNYDPQPLWNVGAQIVALNYQTNDKYMQRNDGKFMDNGACGYLLKPEYLRDRSLKFDPENPPVEYAKVLKLTIISGQQLPKTGYGHSGEIIDPYVKVHVWGMPYDQQSWSTRYVQNNGFNPVWNETRQFVVRCPELATLRLTIMDHDTRTSDDFIAQYVTPLMAVSTGYRHIHHFISEKSDMVPGCSIFTHTTLTPYQQQPAEQQQHK